MLSRSKRMLARKRKLIKRLSNCVLTKIIVCVEPSPPRDHQRDANHRNSSQTLGQTDIKLLCSPQFLGQEAAIVTVHTR